MAAFAIVGLAIQVLLVAFFVAQLRRAPWQLTVGRLVYGAGLATAALAAALALTGEPWHRVLAPVLYTAWAALGAGVDLVRPVEWRNPPRWIVLVPYAALLMGSLLAFWIPLWWIDIRLWLAFGVLYAIHTIINLATHGTRRGPASGQRRTPA
jgi:hypothetical protein